MAIAEPNLVDKSNESVDDLRRGAWIFSTFGGGPKAGDLQRSGRGDGVPRLGSNNCELGAEQ